MGYKCVCAVLCNADIILVVFVPSVCLKNYWKEIDIGWCEICDLLTSRTGGIMVTSHLDLWPWAVLIFHPDTPTPVWEAATRLAANAVRWSPLLSDRVCWVDLQCTRLTYWELILMGVYSPRKYCPINYCIFWNMSRITCNVTDGFNYYTIGLCICKSVFSFS